MSSVSNIVAFDGASTPVQHTLVPVSVTRNAGRVEAIWRAVATGVPVEAQVRCTMSLSQNGNGVYRAESRVEVPVMESVSGQNASGYTAAPKVAYIDTVVTTGLFHSRSTASGRRLVRQLAVNIDNGITTTVVPVTTGPLPELFDLLVAPT